MSVGMIDHLNVWPSPEHCLSTKGRNLCIGLSQVKLNKVTTCMGKWQEGESSTSELGEAFKPSSLTVFLNVSSSFAWLPCE
jgi:hypothetical protein